MQADVILKEPPPWMPPISLSGGAHVEGGGGGRPPPRTPLLKRANFKQKIIPDFPIGNFEFELWVLKSGLQILSNKDKEHNLLNSTGKRRYFSPYC